jgi:hypothetical protein
MNRSAAARTLLLTTAALVLSTGAQADEAARLTVELKVSGTEAVRASGPNSDHAEGRFNDSYRFATTVRGSGELTNVNVKDPHYAEKMMAHAARVQQQVERRQPARPAGPQLTPEQLEARAVAGQQACQGDLNCLMKLSQELQGHMMATQPASPAPAAAYIEDQEDDYRYLDFFGGEDCDTSIRVVIDRMLTGEYADVQGMVPYSVRRTADYAGNDLQRQLTCLAASLVLDVEDQVFYTVSLGMPEATGRYVRDVRGRPVESGESPLSLQAEISEWVAQQLRQAPVSGQRRATIALGQDRSAALGAGDYTGQAEVELNWTLERL